MTERNYRDNVANPGGALTAGPFPPDTPPTPTPQFLRVTQMQSRAIDSVVFATAGNVDKLEPVLADGLSRFTFAGGFSADEGFNQQTCEWSWGGASPITILVELRCSAGNIGGVVEKEWALGISVDGDLDGVTLGAGASAAAEKGPQFGQITKTDGYDTIVCSRYFNVGNGSTVKPVACLFGLDAALHIAGLTMTVYRCEDAS